MHRFVLRRGAARVDDNEVSLEEIYSVTGEILDYITIYEYSEDGKRFREKVLPYGKIVVKTRDGKELVFNAINPIVKVEDIVLKLNTVYREKGSPLLIQKTGSTRVVSYER